VSTPVARVFAGLLLLALTGCVEGVGDPSGPTHFIVVSDFAVPEGAVHLDPSFGFSLYRGESGVPTRQRAGSVGRAVAFLVADTIVERLRARGYDATTATAPASSSYRALIVSGTFRAIDEGARRRVGNERSAVIADVEINATLGNGTTQPVQRFAVDSRSAPPAPPQGTATGRETGVNADATRLGAEVARVVAEVARRNNWVPAVR
jgi:hypothetical protein